MALVNSNLKHLQDVIDHLKEIPRGQAIKGAISVAAFVIACKFLWKTVQDPTSRLNDLVLTKTLKYSVEFDENNYGGRLFAEAFRNHGVQFVFTLTGGHIAPILVGCKEVGIRVIDVRHEVNAVFAADAVSRLSGIPGVAVVTAGPGLTNTITAVKNAQMAQSPLILIGGATSDLLKGKGSLQDIDQFALLKPHVKWAVHITKIADIVPAVEKAFRISQSGVPGPVFIEVALDALYREKDARDFYNPTIQKLQSTFFGRVMAWYIGRHLKSIFSGKEISFHTPLPVDIPHGTSRQVRAVAEVLRKAKRPVIMIGSQSVLDFENVVNGTFVKSLIKLGVPVLLSGMARGLLGKESLHIRHKDSRRMALREADVVIIAGLPFDFRLDYGNSITRKCTLISINRDPVDLTKNRTPDIGVLGDPCDFLIRVVDEIGEEDLKSAWTQWHSALLAKDAETDDKITKDSQHELQDGKINPMAVCTAMEQLIHNNSIIVADGGDFVGTAAYIVRPRAPLCWLDPGPFGTLGVGCGFALGAKLCRPNSEVWVVFGDGAVGFSIAEFDTFVRHNIPVIAVVGNDAAWMQILRAQVKIFNTDVGGSLVHTHYEEVAKGFGAQGLEVTKTSEIVSTLKKAKEIATKHPVLVNVIIGKTDFREGSLSM